MTAWYNENDPKAAAWLRELIKGGHIADGVVDERSIEDVGPRELDGYTQCHFFAGIGGWSYALRLAGIGDDERIWTGSCPCQPFSAAGKGKGFADERHLWPAWFHLVRECKPERIFGEQVANAMQWIDLVQGDLENEGYACGYAVLGAHSVGAPHIRQRLYWMAYTDGGNESAEWEQRGGKYGQQSENSSIADRRLEYTESDRRVERRPEPSKRSAVSGCGSSGVVIPTGEQVGVSGRPWKSGVALGDSDNERSQGWSERRDGTDERFAWAASLVDCRDGKRRPVEPGTFPLAHGIPGRVGLLRGYGNAVVPQVAAAFIQASGLG